MTITRKRESHHSERKDYRRGDACFGQRPKEEVWVDIVNRMDEAG